jgi:transcription-repair coupling factor (superfamily II helicase)
MRDLEIRGAGNLLGDEQSGHVAALGFELYLADARRGRARDGRRLGDDEPEPVRLDVNVDAYVPADYVPYEQAKVDVHRRVAAARDVADLGAAARRSSRIASARCPSRWSNLIALQQGAASSSAARARGWSPSAARCSRPRRWSSRSEQATSYANVYRGALRARPQPGAASASTRRRGRFRIVVAAADALLAVTGARGDLTAA